MYKQYPLVPHDAELIGKSIVNAAFRIHKTLGPGLLEKVYEACMEFELEKMDYKVQRQCMIPIIYDEMTFNEGLRLDLLINDTVIIELKAQDNYHPVWKAQLLSHLKLTNNRLGYLINFNVPLIKDGITRMVI